MIVLSQNTQLGLAEYELLRNSHAISQHPPVRVRGEKMSKRCCRILHINRSGFNHTYSVIYVVANPVRGPRFSLSMEMSRLTRDGTAEPVSRDQILKHARGQGNIHFPCSADHEQDWQPYPVDPYPAICDDHT